MKQINVALALLLFSMAALAQREGPVNPQKDKQEIEGYTIRLLPAMGGTYGYDIVRGKQLIVHQSYNPFTLSPISLSKKEDVFKVAQWQIEQLRQGKPLTAGRPLVQGNNIKLPPSLTQKVQMQGSYGPLINQRIPSKVAEDLQINIAH